MGTLGEHPHTRFSCGIPSEAPWSSKTHQNDRFPLSTIPTHHCAKTSHFWRGGRCQGTPNLNPQLRPSSTVCTSTLLPTSDKDWLTLFLHFSIFPISPFSPFLRSSVTLLHSPLCSSLRSHFVTLFLCFSATSFPSFLSSFSSLFICFFTFPKLQFSNSPILWFSGSLEFQSYRELFNLYLFTSSNFINGLIVVSLYAPFISIPRDPVFQGPLFHCP